MEELSVLAIPIKIWLWFRLAPLSVLILIHAMISCRNFWQIKCIDKNSRPLLISKLQFKTK